MFKKNSSRDFLYHAVLLLLQIFINFCKHCVFYNLHWITYKRGDPWMGCFLIWKRGLRNAVWRQSSHKTAAAAERSARVQDVRSALLLCSVSRGTTDTMAAENRQLRIFRGRIGVCFLWRKVLVENKSPVRRARALSRVARASAASFASRHRALHAAAKLAAAASLAGRGGGGVLFSAWGWCVGDVVRAVVRQTGCQSCHWRTLSDWQSRLQPGDCELRLRQRFLQRHHEERDVLRGRRVLHRPAQVRRRLGWASSFPPPPVCTA